MRLVGASAAHTATVRVRSLGRALLYVVFVRLLFVWHDVGVARMLWLGTWMWTRPSDLSYRVRARVRESECAGVGLSSVVASSRSGIRSTQSSSVSVCLFCFGVVYGSSVVCSPGL